MIFRPLPGNLPHLSLILALAVLLLPLAAWAAPENEKRIALVIGVGSYQNAPHLTNPANDARAIGESLRRLKFDVTELYDPDFRELNSGIRAFGIRAASADVVVVYYAGHGVQVDRENYLIPVDAKLERERDLLYEAMPLDRLLGEVSQANRIGIVLLDSCRNNPFIDRVSRSMSIAGRAVSTTAGLARVDNVPRNTMVVMAAKADQIAEDGADHSPFAAALLAHFQIPGLELSLFFRSVRDTVLRATSNRQEPYVFSSLGADPFYFYPRPPNRSPEIGAIKPVEVNEVAGPTLLGMPKPTDPDQDPLTIRIIGIPHFGEVRVDGRVVAMNTVFSVDRLKTATFKPDGTGVGPAGTLDILIEDGRGGSATGSLPVIVRSAHRAPVVTAPGRVQMVQQMLGIPAPTSLDGDPLTVTIDTIPRGTVRNGAAIVHPGDHVTPQELSKLSFWPDAGFVGPAGSLRYTVDNGHGGTATGSLDIDVAPVAGNATASSEVALWDIIHNSNDPTEFEAFLRRFPASRYVDEAKRRYAMLTDGAGSGRTQVAAKPEPGRPPEKTTVEAAPSKRPDQSVSIAVPPSDKISAGPSSQMIASSSPLATMPRSGNGSATRFQDCPTCPWMITVPAGGFMMGQGSREPEAMPAHHVDIRAFAIGQTPVTVAEWKACVAALACNFTPRMLLSEDRTPVHNVSWDDVGQYIAWLSNAAKHTYRLPSEAEWEYAARGGTTTRYWWGDSINLSLANCIDCGGAQDIRGPMPVDMLPANPFGLYDLLGGVAQWTADCWFPNYRGAPADATPRDVKGCAKRVLRGGSFRSSRDQVTVTYRGNYDAPVRYIVNGFRIARDREDAAR